MTPLYPADFDQFLSWMQDFENYRGQDSAIEIEVDFVLEMGIEAFQKSLDFETVQRYCFEVVRAEGRI